MKPVRLALFLCACALAQEGETPHQTFEKARALGLSPDTIEQVEPLLEKAVQGFRSVDSGNPEYPQALAMLGIVKQSRVPDDIQRTRDIVEPLYRKALALYDRSVSPPDPAQLALTLELEAAALNNIGEVQEATPLSERALAIRKDLVREMQAGSPRAGAAYRIGNGISAPSLVSKNEPEYTDVARLIKCQGTVMLHIVIDGQGLPRDISLARGLGFGLDENAVRAVRTWRFRPGVNGNNEPVPVMANIEVNFRIP